MVLLWLAVLYFKNFQNEWSWWFNIVAVHNIREIVDCLIVSTNWHCGTKHEQLF